MDGRQDQVVLVEVRVGGLRARGPRWIEGQIGEEALSRRRGGSQLLELLEVSEAYARVVVETLEVRLVPAAHQPHLRAPR